MRTIKVSSLKAGVLTVGAVLVMLWLVPYASANVIRINFSGDAGSGYADLTVVSDPDASSNYDPDVLNPDSKVGQYDPVDAQIITGASGGFNGTSITGVKARNYANPPPPATLPKSYSTVAPSSTKSPTNFLASYDNLFYANGSPVVCPPGPAHPDGYPFSGGFLDVYGVMFELDNDNLLGLWSDGVVPPGFQGLSGGLTYGLSVLRPNAEGDGYALASMQFAGATASVPAPKFIWVFGAMLLGLFVWLRQSTEKRKQLRSQVTV